MSAVREQGGHRAPFLLARALVLGTLVASLAAPSFALSSAAAPHRENTSSPGDVQVELLASPGSSGIVRANGSIRVRVTMTNTGEVTSENIDVALAVAGSYAVDPGELAQWFAGDGDPTRLTAVALATLPPLEPGASAVLDLAPPASDQLLTGGFGARLIAVTATMDGKLLADERTAVVWVPSTSTPDPASITFVAPISTPRETTAFLSASVLARYTAPTGALTRALDAVAGRPVLLAIDPRVIASIRLLGSDAPASATIFLERLELAPNESFLLPWADADPLATIVAVGAALPAPEGIGQRENNAASQLNGASADPAPEPRAASVTTIDELSVWPVALRRWSWPAPESLTVTALPVLTESGVDVIITPDVEQSTAVAVHSAGGARLVSVDPALARAARAASAASSQQRFDRAFAQVSALLSAHAVSHGSQQVVIPLARDELSVTNRRLDTIAQTISLPWTTAGLASSALRAQATIGTIRTTPESDSRSNAVSAALDAESADRLFAQIALTPEFITDVRRLELLAALSLGWGERSESALQEYVAQSRELQASVQVAESSDVLLLADRATLPVTVRNDLDVAVRVFVRVEPDSGQLRVLEPNVETLLEPRSLTRALVPVESLTNGQVDITVSVRDAQLEVVGTSTRVSLNLQAGWETAGTVIAALVVTLLFIGGITRDIRKRRRRAEGGE